MRKDAFGLPLGELLMWTVIAGIALGVLGHSIQMVLELTEKTAVETAVTHMRSGLRLEKVRRMANGLPLGDLPGRNPLEFLASTGPSSLNALSEQIRPLDFRFDPQRHQLVYHPERQRFLKMQQSGADKELTWQTRATQPDGSDVELVLLTPYEWF
ncbi:hypothetical protein [Uliginosibacterium sp. TH139]|uniref:hypothetical protein n=1 Tax=Uliginosibacterium sp. TH139 TaxID=2067453 RepID=UPI000C7E73F9|nr:hypothetical protein [Uliginosibacterium sp. TH139]PLK48588.1 hypothetical protein C0V76_11030 [Uliginosibacterium sp. TH139]